LTWLKTQKADFKVDFPSSIKGGESPYSNVSSPFFQWKVTFYEKSGKIGYKVDGSGWYYDIKGDAYGTNGYIISTNDLSIKPGGKETYDTWFSGERFVGGYILFNFKGEDAGGHPINVQVRINCR